MLKHKNIQFHSLGSFELDFMHLGFQGFAEIFKPASHIHAVISDGLERLVKILPIPVVTIFCYQNINGLFSELDPFAIENNDEQETAFFVFSDE